MFVIYSHAFICWLQLIIIYVIIPLSSRTCIGFSTVSMHYIIGDCMIRNTCRGERRQKYQFLNHPLGVCIHVCVCLYVW